MIVERIIALGYLFACIAIGILASRKVIASRDEYWVAGRRIGTFVNSMAIMAALASGGSIIGVMGLAYAQGIPATLALFTGAIVGFPIASILVAAPLRRFGRFTITDFLKFRYPNSIVRNLVPVLIVVTFTVYIIAQMKAAGITATALLGIDYETSLTLATLVFVLYVSFGGMLAITWTDVFQGVLMVTAVLGTAVVILWRIGSPMTIMAQASSAAPELGQLANRPLAGYLGNFVIWAAAIPIIPHIVMRVFTARDAQSARVSLNFAMLIYAAIILAAVLIVVPIGKMNFPGLTDPDQIFLRIMSEDFPPVFRGIAVAAVLAAVMSTTDALLLACSSAIAHDLLGDVIHRKMSPKAGHWLSVAVAWIIGLIAMAFAYSPPALITEFYTIAIGLLSAGLFVPTIAGLWWRRANLAGGTAALLVGAITYVAVHFTPGVPAGSAILAALPASAIAMWLGGRIGSPDAPELIEQIANLHKP
ncbi:MAG: sodium:solute symporter family protein [Acidobacteria bacterium]|nr:sodium:solute symporter family protein [Acidobacteriota bacterium]